MHKTLSPTSHNCLVEDLSPAGSTLQRINDQLQDRVWENPLFRIAWPRSFYKVRDIRDKD